MKKTYNSPETIVVRVVQHLMTGASMTGKQGNDSFNVNFSDDTYDGEAASRHRSQWDEDEDEEL